MKLSILLAAMEHEPARNAADPDIAGIAYDSRAVKPGFVFFALRGRNKDGNQFVQDSVERGAVAVVSEEAAGIVPGRAVFIRVKDARAAMARAACAFYGYPSEQLRVVGITGTNGKTTVSFMIRDIITGAGRPKPGMIGTINYEIGERAIPARRTTPESPDIQNLLRQIARAGCRTAVMEVSSHALVQQRVRGVEFDMVIFTNLTHDHLDYHGDMENYFRAKTLLFPPLGRGKKEIAAIINVDDPWGVKLADIVRKDGSKPITYGRAQDAVVRAADVELGAEGSHIRVRSPWGDAQFSMRLLGRFNISNALAAFACCGSLGVEPSVIARSLAAMGPVRGRLERIETDDGINIFVDYAHTEDALRNVLTTLREITTGRVILIFGCGGDRDSAKRPLMGATASELADYTVLTSDNPRREDPSDIISGIEKGFEGRTNYEVIEDRRAAIARGLSFACSGDTVIIAGKGHENYQELADRTIPFDDAGVVREILMNPESG